MRSHITAHAVRRVIAIAIAASSIGTAVTLAAAPSAPATSIAAYTANAPVPGPSGLPWG